MTKELTPRQVRERAKYKAEIEVSPKALKAEAKTKTPRTSIRDYLRKQAGWPALKGR